jgi:hypothetical protein
MTLDDISQLLDPDETILTVDVTPDGHGDSVRTFLDGSLMFVQPNECEMSLREFQQRLRRPRTGDAKTTNVDINGRPIVSRCHKVGDKTATQTSLPDDSIVYYSRQVGFLLKWIAIYTLYLTVC